MNTKLLAVVTPPTDIYHQQTQLISVIVMQNLYVMLNPLMILKIAIFP